MRIMVLTDRKRIPVTEQEESAVTKALDESHHERLTVRGVSYKASMIAYFDDATYEENQMYYKPQPAPTEWSIEREGCKGDQSIQHEINNIIKGEHPLPQDWGPRIQSTKYREAIRLKLRKMFPDRKWCDYRAGECACE